ncbi:RNA-binding protein 48 [Ostrinia nubilalis]|uniref:RNA-binding protein 48 n=1 Tax=Ostrinia nubilalis TaxID=29057 RepID=UPI0030822B16
MDSENAERELLLPHHEQQSLCTTRLPYRQGRKLTAVKVYTVNNESNHLLVFGVPSLNLRQEAKALFAKFGKLLQFNISKDHAAEVFTETYHVLFEKIQSARLAKRMLDTKNFYGGSLHICYAPELEDVSETRSKLLQRQKDVIFRLKNLQKPTNIKKTLLEKVTEMTVEHVTADDTKKLNMGDINTINLENNTLKRKKNQPKPAQEKHYKPCFLPSDSKASKLSKKSSKNHNNDVKEQSNLKNSDFRLHNDIEIIDCTSADLETVTNINESPQDLGNIEIDGQSNKISLNDQLNYNNFGNEDIRKVPSKSVNKIKFSLNKR